MNTKTTGIVKKQPKEVSHLTPWEEMDEAFDALFQGRLLRPFQGLFPGWPAIGRGFDLGLPKVDLLERKDEFLVRVELPGVDKKDLDISINGNALTIKGERKKEEKEEQGVFFHSEITRGRFNRMLQLPAEVDQSGVKAELNDGLLEIHLPRSRRSEAKRITVH